MRYIIFTLDFALIPFDFYAFLSPLLTPITPWVPVVVGYYYYVFFHIFSFVSLYHISETWSGCIKRNSVAASTSKNT